jgi:branched-chain amino acid transport system substrate-binding protein
MKILEKRALTKIQAVVVTVVVIIAAIGGGFGWWYLSQPREVAPIKIGCVHPLTGYSMLLGEFFRKGVVLAVEEMNAKGGILGRPIELYWADDKCAPAEGVTAINKVISTDQVDAILGPQCSSSVLAVMPIVNASSPTPMLICAATSPKITEFSGTGGNRWTFRVNPHDGLMGPALATYLKAQFNPHSMAMIVLNNDWGRGNVMVWQQLAQQYNITMLSIEYFDYGETNFLPILTSIKALNPDCIFLAADYEEGYHIMTVYHELGMTQLVVGRGGVGTAKFAEKFGKEIAEGILGINFWTTGINNTKHNEFVQKFILRWNELPDIVAAWAYVEAYVLAEAIKNAGTTNKAAVRDALQKIDIDTMLGRVKFDDHNQAYCPVYVYMIHDGEEKLLGEVPTAPP